MRSLTTIAAGAVLLMTGATAFAATGPSPKAQAQLAKAIEGRVAGKPVDCINLRDIRSTEVIDGTAIIYRVSGSKLYVNTPRSGQSALNSSNVPVLRTSISQLCSVDTLQMYDTASRFPTGAVFLGEFVPYTKAAKD
jgi:hypothetical protein